MTLAAIIVAAGRGTRAGAGLPKQWRTLAGRPVAAHTLGAFAGTGLFAPIVLVIHPEDAALARQACAGQEVRIVHGGATRGASVRAGLAALADTAANRVLIHDAARPLVSAALIQRVCAALDRHQAAAPAVPVTDALWRGRDGFVAEVQDRAGLFRAQTPQGFHLDAITQAHNAQAGTGAADDVEVARAAGIAVAIVAGDVDNLKLTTAADFDRAERILGCEMDIRTGNGYDVHRFGPGDHVMLCGVAVPHDRGLQGHSDADVGMHALTDAIYGALALGDIGRHFPPSDPRWKGADSRVFLAHAAEAARARGYRLTSADVTLVCELPRIGPHADIMRATLADIIGAEPDRVSVKATTSERLGFTGRAEGIAAQATATLVKP